MFHLSSCSWAKLHLYRKNFPSIQFLINGFSLSHILDWNSKGGGFSWYIRDKIIVLPLNRYSLPPHVKILFFELSLRNWKWFVCCSYNPHKNLIKEHLQVFTEGIQFYKHKWEEKKSRSERNISKKQLKEESWRWCGNKQRWGQ